MPPAGACVVGWKMKHYPDRHFAFGSNRQAKNIPPRAIFFQQKQDKPDFLFGTFTRPQAPLPCVQFADWRALVGGTVSDSIFIQSIIS
jgi:hypothetical protein